MTLTKEQQKEAEEQYRYNQLTPREKQYMEQMTIYRAALSEAERAYKNGQEFCPHPLIMRETENKGSTGNWDQQDYYWTNHKCLLCDKRWTTNQRWEHVGDKMGHPNDEEAKEE